MKESTTREKILKSLRNGLLTKTAENNISAGGNISFFDIKENDLSVAFAETFSQSGGTFSYCMDEDSIKNQIDSILVRTDNENLICYSKSFYEFIKSLGILNVSLANSNESYPLGIMLCENLIAQDGSITISEKQGFKNRFTCFPETFIIFGFTSQIVDTYKTSINQIRMRYTENPPKSIITLRKNEESKLIVILVEDQ